jgi:hypothetical protein
LEERHGQEKLPSLTTARLLGILMYDEKRRRHYRARWCRRREEKWPTCSPGSAR